MAAFLGDTEGVCYWFYIGVFFPTYVRTYVYEYRIIFKYTVLLNA